jgi:hypothetical protein
VISAVGIVDIVSRCPSLQSHFLILWTKRERRVEVELDWSIIAVVLLVVLPVLLYFLNVRPWSHQPVQPVDEILPVVRGTICLVLVVRVSFVCYYCHLLRVPGTSNSSLYYSKRSVNEWRTRYLAVVPSAAIKRNEQNKKYKRLSSKIVEKTMKYNVQCKFFHTTPVVGCF